MKIRKVRIGIRDLEAALRKFIATGKEIEAGNSVKTEKGVYFTSIEAFRKAITPKRLALLREIKLKKPSSVRQLSEMTERDLKNVSSDIKFLEQVGLLDIKRNDEIEKEVRPFVGYDKILFEIAV